MCYLLAVTLRFVVAGLFSLVVTYCMHSLARSLWFLSLMIWTAKDCCVMLLLILGFFANLALKRLQVLNGATFP
jgi:hypothetical protein